MMIESDLELAKKEKTLLDAGYENCSSQRDLNSFSRS
jgi:hypothetical protein